MVRIVFLVLDIAYLPCHLGYEYYYIIAEKKEISPRDFLMWVP